MFDRRIIKRLVAGFAGLIFIAMLAGFTYGLTSQEGDSVAGGADQKADSAASRSGINDDAIGTRVIDGSDAVDLDSSGALSVSDSDSEEGSENSLAPPSLEDAVTGANNSPSELGVDTDGDDSPSSSSSTLLSNAVTSTTESSTAQSTTTKSSTTEPSDDETKEPTTVSTTKEEESTTSPGATSTSTSKPAQSSSGGRFVTLPPGSVLPSGSECARRVRSVAERIPENRPYNQTRGRRPTGTYLSTDPNFDGSSYEARIDGNFTGSTDEIIQWAACKWGFDEDLLRAQVYTESSWFAGKLGDCNENAQARTGGQGGCSSLGLIQVRSAGIDRNPHPGLFPIVWESSAMNLDYALAVKRLCFEGDEVWLSDISSTYRAGDEWNCMGRWFSGSWDDAGAKNYLAKLRENLNRRPWEGPYVGCKDWRESFYCSGIDRPTVTD